MSDFGDRVSPSIASSAMKQPFGAKPAGSYMCSMRWIAANHKKEDAAPASMIGENCQRPRMTIVEFGGVDWQPENIRPFTGAATSKMRGKAEAAVDFVVLLRDQLLAR
jgi:hypothetical protein